MEKQSDVIFLKYLQDAIDTLNKIDDLIDSNGKRQSEIDSELQDILHLIENQEIDNHACPKIMKRVHELRRIRRSLKNEYELITKYSEVKNRLISKENRQFLTAEINKKWKSLGVKYTNRILTEEQIQDLLRPEKNVIYQVKSRTRSTSEKSQHMNEKIKEMLEKGCSQKEIAIELNISQPSVSTRIKRLKEEENA